MGENIDIREQVTKDIRDSLIDSLLLRSKRRPTQDGTPYLQSTRTDGEDLAEVPITVIFGCGDKAREFHLYPKPHLEADEWRQAALNVFNQARPLLMSELNISNAAAAIQSGESVFGFVNLFVMGIIPAMAELVFAWEPSLPREQILNELEATDTQLATAFLACLQLAFPFFSTLKEVSRLMQGNQTKTTETSKAPEQKNPAGA